jgi:hypothetical protein
MARTKIFQLTDEDEEFGPDAPAPPAPTRAPQPTSEPAIEPAHHATTDAAPVEEDEEPWDFDEDAPYETGPTSAENTRRSLLPLALSNRTTAIGALVAVVLALVVLAWPHGHRTLRNAPVAQAPATVTKSAPAPATSPVAAARPAPHHRARAAHQARRHAPQAATAPSVAAAAPSPAPSPAPAYAPAPSHSVTDGGPPAEFQPVGDPVARVSTQPQGSRR